MSTRGCSPGTTVQWREIDSSTPRDPEHFIILWCREDDSYWWASWQGGMWYGCDDFGLRRTSESYTPDYWCERPIFREPVDPGSAQQPSGSADALRQALDAIQAQCDEMRSLKGWRLNLIRENLAKAYGAVSSTSHSPSAEQQLAEAGKAAIAIRNELDRTRAERDSWEAQFHSAAAAASEYSEFWEKHQRDFDQFGNYLPYSQIDGDLRAAKTRIAALESRIRRAADSSTDPVVARDLREALTTVPSNHPREVGK